MWGIMYFMNPHHQNKDYQFFISFADGFFALAIVLSFFRMVYLCQITRFLGLLQLCLGRMLQVNTLLRLQKYIIDIAYSEPSQSSKRKVLRNSWRLKSINYFSQKNSITDVSQGPEYASEFLFYM